jgi:hypothetical protein
MKKRFPKQGSIVFRPVLGRFGRGATRLGPDVARTGPKTVCRAEHHRRGRTIYSVEYLNDLAPSNAWHCLAFLQLPVTNYLWFDPTAQATVRRFYPGDPVFCTR